MIQTDHGNYSRIYPAEGTTDSCSRTSKLTQAFTVSLLGVLPQIMLCAKEQDGKRSTWCFLKNSLGRYLEMYGVSGAIIRMLPRNVAIMLQSAGPCASGHSLKPIIPFHHTWHVLNVPDGTEIYLASLVQAAFHGLHPK